MLGVQQGLPHGGHGAHGGSRILLAAPRAVVEAQHLCHLLAGEVFPWPTVAQVQEGCGTTKDARRQCGDHGSEAGAAPGLQCLVIHLHLIGGVGLGVDRGKLMRRAAR